VNAHPVDSGRSVRDDGLVCCAVGDEQYALRGADVRQIVRVEKMLGAAGSGGRAGTLNVGSQAVPVFRLGSVLGRPPVARRDPHGAGQHIAVTGEPGALVGWLVDRIVRTSLSQGAQVVALPAVVGPVATTWFEAVVKLGDSSVLLLAPQYLDPFERRPVRYADTRAFTAAAPRTGRSAERMVLLFSTPALPRCAARRYALSGRRIAAIVQPLSPIVVPGSAPHVTGVAWWRDAVVPLIDFRGPGDHDDAAHGRRCVIAQCGAQLGGTLVAFPVDSEIALHRPEAENRQAAGVPRPPFAVGMFDIDGEAVALLDLDTLLAPEQRDNERIPA
jgi:chemotaxis signal transduction protein